MKKIIVMATVLSLLISCAPTTSSRYREGDNRGQQTSLTVADEKRLADAALPELVKDYPAAKSAELQNYASSIGRKIVLANDLEGKPYHYEFTVVDSKNPNAFAMPAGKIFVTASLIEVAANEAELAGVIGHEIGHVVARHAAERMYVMEKEQGKAWLYGAGGGILGGVVGYGLGKVICGEDDKACYVKAAAIGAAAGAGGGLIVQKYRFLVNSREDEMEADRIGFRLAVNSGYDKDKVGDFYKKLLQIEKKGGGQNDPLTRKLADALSTHPPSEERVRQMEQLAAARPVVKNAVVDSPQFRKAKKIAAEPGAAGRR
ncbi:MAG: M48 family metalloprotease [Syntrophales bacterium]